MALGETQPTLYKTAQFVDQQVDCSQDSSSLFLTVYPVEKLTNNTSLLTLHSLPPLKAQRKKVETYPLSTYITEGRQSQYSIFDRT